MKRFLVFLVLLLMMAMTTNTTVWAAKEQNAAPEKAIAVKASVDIGDNITILLEKIAKQIGTTADKVFPWYVKQQILTGYLFLIIDGIALLLGGCLMFSFYGKADWNNGNRYVIFTIVGAVILFSALVGVAAGASKAITQIYNPEFHALQTLVKDMSQLTGR